MTDSCEESNDDYSSSCEENYEYEYFLDYVLHTYKDYLQMFKTDSVDKDLRYNLVFVGDSRLEQPLEKLIREAKAELLIPSKFNNGRRIEKVIDDQSNLPKECDYYFDGYLMYLLTAWKNYLGIEVAPWFFWNVILYNLKEINKQNPEKFRKLWTNRKDKTKFTINDTKFDIKKYIERVKELCPTNTIDKLYVKFDGQPENYEESIYGVLADMSNDYYDCMILSCNIPTVKVLGSKDEWNHLSKSIDDVKDHYKNNDCLTVDVERYLDKCNNFIKECIDNLSNEEYWSQFFYVDKCGSGHQTKISGHVVELLLNNETLISSTPKITSRFNFDIHDGEKVNKGSYISGLMSGDVVDGVLVGKYSYLTTKYKFTSVKETEVKSKTDLIRCLEILNSYVRPNVHHNIPPERGYNDIFKYKAVILGDISVDEQIEILKQEQKMRDEEYSKMGATGKQYDFGKTRELLEKRRSKFIGKKVFDILEDNLNHCKETMRKMRNFWDGDEFNRTRMEKPVVDNVKWIHGRRIQEDEGHAKLLCDNMEQIFEYLSNKTISRIHRNDDTDTAHVINMLLSSYHEDVYLKLLEVAPKYTNYKNKTKYGKFTKDHMACEIFLFLFNGYMADEWEMGRIDSNNKKLFPKTTSMTYHKGLVLEHLINALLCSRKNYEKCMGGISLLSSKVPALISSVLDKNNYDGYTQIHGLRNLYKNMSSDVMKEMFRLDMMTRFILRYTKHKNKMGEDIKDFKDMFNYVLSTKHPGIIYADGYNKSRFEYIDFEDKRYDKFPEYIENLLDLSLLCNTDCEMHILDKKYRSNRNNRDDEVLTDKNQCLWFYDEIITKYYGVYENDRSENDVYNYSKKERTKRLIDAERYNKKTKEHQALYDNITEHIYEIHIFLAYNDTCEGSVIKSLMYTFNPDFLVVFIDKFIEMPFNLGQSNVFGGGGMTETLKIFATESNSSLITQVKDMIGGVDPIDLGFHEDGFSARDPMAKLEKYTTKYDLLINYLIELSRVKKNNYYSVIDDEVIDNCINALCNRYKDELKLISCNFLDRADMLINYLIKETSKVRGGYGFSCPENQIKGLKGRFGEIVRKLVEIGKITGCEVITLESLSKVVSNALNEEITYDSFEENRERSPIVYPSSVDDQMGYNFPSDDEDEQLDENNESPNESDNEEIVE